MGACAPLINSLIASIFLLLPSFFLSSLHLAITVISASVIGSDMGLRVNVWLLQSEKLKVCLCVCITVRTCVMGDKAE